MPVLMYRGNGGGSSAFGMSPREFLRFHTSTERVNNPVYGTIVIIVALVIISIFLTLAPNSAQPFATHGAIIILMLIPFCLTLKFLTHYVKKKCSHRSINFNETDDTRDETSSYRCITNTGRRRSSSIFTLPSIETNETHGSVLSFNEYPPKYELPPSYSEAISIYAIDKHSHYV